MVSATPAVANNSHGHPSKAPITPSNVIAAKRKGELPLRLGKTEGMRARRVAPHELQANRTAA